MTLESSYFIYNCKATGEVYHFHLQEPLVDETRLAHSTDIARKCIGSLITEIKKIAIGGSPYVKLIVLVTTTPLGRIDGKRSSQPHVACTQTNCPSCGGGEVGMCVVLSLYILIADRVA